MEYNLHLSAAVKFLHLDYLKSADVGEGAKLKAIEEDKIHKERVMANEEENAKVAKIREARLAKQREDRDLEIKKLLAQEHQKEKLRLEMAAHMVKETKEVVASCIKPEELEEAIETALENPIDYEYAIDLQGHIFRGRETRSMAVDTKEKIPVPEDPRDILKIRCRDTGTQHESRN